MKLRQFDFKKIDIIEEGPNGTDIKSGYLDYYMTAKDVLNTPSSQNGMSTEEILTAVTTFAKFRDAFKDGKPSVYLDDESYNLLKTRIDSFRWAKAHPVIADFIKYVRNLPEVPVEVKRAE